MIDFNEITKIASRYADMYITDMDEFFAAYDEAVQKGHTLRQSGMRSVCCLTRTITARSEN